MNICYDCRYCIPGYEAQDSICDRPRMAKIDVVTGIYDTDTVYCYDERYEGGCGLQGLYFEREVK